MCVLLFFGVVVVIYYIGQVLNQTGVFGLILIQRRRESYIPPRITHMLESVDSNP